MQISCKVFFPKVEDVHPLFPGGKSWKGVLLKLAPYRCTLNNRNTRGWLTYHPVIWSLRRILPVSSRRVAFFLPDSPATLLQLPSPPFHPLFPLPRQAGWTLSGRNSSSPESADYYPRRPAFAFLHLASRFTHTQQWPTVAKCNCSKRETRFPPCMPAATFES